MWFAERVARQDRGEKELNLTDALVVGTFQFAALVPGVSRSGATISGGLIRGLDRVTATRLSFFLSIPALLAAGLFELKDALGGSISVGETARRYRRRVRRGLRDDRLAAAVRGPPPDHVVRALPARARRSADRAAGHGRDVGDLRSFSVRFGPQPHEFRPETCGWGPNGTPQSHPDRLKKIHRPSTLSSIRAIAYA